MATPEVLNHRPNCRRATKRDTWQRYLVLAAACCGTFVGFGSVVIFTFGIFLKPLTNSFGWTRSQVSLAFTLTALTVAVCSPVIGRFVGSLPGQTCDRSMHDRLWSGIRFAKLVNTKP